MAKICFYCGQPASGKDHVIPKALFDPPIPAKPKLPTVWACESCNGNFSKDEPYFRDILVGARVSEKNPVAAKLLAGPVSRSFQRKTSYNPREKYLRNMSFIPVANEILPVSRVDAERFDNIIGKIIKGLLFCRHGLRLPENHIIEVYPFLNGEWLQDPLIIELLNEPPKESWDKVFTYILVHDKDYSGITLYVLIFYEYIIVLAVTLPHGS